MLLVHLSQLYEQCGAALDIIEKSIILSRYEERRMLSYVIIVQTLIVLGQEKY